MKLSRFFVLCLLFPLTVLAAVTAGRLIVANITGYPALALTRSTDGAETRQEAAREARRQQKPDAQYGAVFLVEYADKGTQECTVRPGQLGCEVDEDTLKGPPLLGIVDGDIGSDFQSCSQVITGFTPYGTWQLTIVRQGDQVSYNWHYQVEGYTAEYGMLCGYQW